MFRVTSATWELKVCAVIEKAREIKSNGPQPLSTCWFRGTLGLGREGLLLRQVFVKVKGSVSNTRAGLSSPALYAVNEQVLRQLCLEEKTQVEGQVLLGGPRVVLLPAPKV